MQVRKETRQTVHHINLSEVIQNTRVFILIPIACGYINLRKGLFGGTISTNTVLQMYQ